MKRALMILLFLLPGTALAALFGIANLTDGGRIEFHSSAGICTGQASHAVYVAKSGVTVAGCWTYQAEPTPALVVWFVDGDAVRVPLSSIRPPSTT